MYYLADIDVVRCGEAHVQLGEYPEHRVAEAAVLNEAHDHLEAVRQHVAHIVLPKINIKIQYLSNSTA